MIEVRIAKEDLRKLRKALHNLGPKRLVGKEFGVFGKNVVQIVKKYPPSVGSPRTGRLGNSWLYKVMNKEEVRIKNSAIYAGYVQGEEQREFHKRHGWKNVFNVIEGEIPKLIKRLEKKVDKIWRK